MPPIFPTIPLTMPLPMSHIYPTVSVLRPCPVSTQPVLANTSTAIDENRNSITSNLNSISLHVPTYQWEITRNQSMNMMSERGWMISAQVELIPSRVCWRMWEKEIEPSEPITIFGISCGCNSVIVEWGWSCSCCKVIMSGVALICGVTLVRYYKYKCKVRV